MLRVPLRQDRPVWQRCVRKKPFLLASAVACAWTCSNGVDTALVQWITAVVQDRSEFALSVVEPFDLRFIDDFSEQPGRRVCLRALAAADAYIVLVPARHLGYQHGLKVLMARWPEHLQGRPCSFVGYGTTTGGEDEVDELGCELLKLQAMPVVVM
ncbi:hypothetical protein EGJ53_02165 [Pseudomonas fluorescens]|nr:hypothetical protein EGJ53_02165 [Pseudomonas fluorescens]